MKSKLKKLLDKETYFIIFFSIFVIGVVITTTLVSHNLSVYFGTVQNVTEERLLIAAKLAAETITDGDQLDEYMTIEDMEKESYKKLVRKMQDFANENDLVYVYFLRNTSDSNFQFIIDSDPIEPLGLDYYEPQDEHTIKAFNGTSSCMKFGEYRETWQGLITAYAPVYNKAGEIKAIVGVDIYDSTFVALARRNSILSIASGIEICLVIIFASILLVRYRRQARAYEYSSNSKSLFLSRMSHEIRTPMNAIIGFCRMANETSDIENIRSYLDHISNSSTFLLQLINSILDISKIEAGKLEFNIEPNSLRDIVLNIENMFVNQAKNKKIELTFSTDQKAPNYIRCDKMYLTQVIVNLLSNAIKFTPEGGKVNAAITVLETSPFAVKLRFSVKDTGIGIKKENIGKVFDAFEQGDNSKTRKFGGTGLGLNISQLLINSMGSTIHVESQVNCGSIFFFDLWLDIVTEYDENELHEETDPSQFVLDLTGKTLLLVEDNEINQIIALNALEEFNATIEVANNGKEGLDIFFANPNKYYLIIMDIQMPEMDGYEATKRIRASNIENAKKIPIIAMSANVFKEDIDASLASGMNAHIGKPFDIDKLKEVIFKVTK